MERLSALDLIFQLLDRRSQPLHLAYLNLHTLPNGAPPDFVRKLAQRLRGYGDPQPPFNRRAQRRLGGMYWVEDEEFDVDYHIVHVALPQPARMRDLLAMVSRIHANLLDRDHPQWRTYLIEGLEGGRVATYSQLHHSVADGIAATRLMMKSMSTAADRQPAPVWAVPPRQLRQRLSVIRHPFGSLARNLLSTGRIVGSVPAIGRELRCSLREFRNGDPDFVSGYTTPACILNQRIAASRRYIAGSFPLSRVKTLGNALDGTVNDVVLAMCAAALRHYLLDLTALPEKPLIADVPYSLRRDASEGGNKIVFLLANLGTHLSDPLRRFELLKRSVEHGKQRYLGMTPAGIFGYNLAMLAPAGLNMLCDINPRWQAFNVVISNTPGPKTALYWQGCCLDHMYPVSVLLDGQALNISLTRRHDALDFGILACRRTLPHIERLLDYLEQGLAELERAALGSSSEVNLNHLRLVGGSDDDSDSPVSHVVSPPQSVPALKRSTVSAKSTKRVTVH